MYHIYSLLAVITNRCFGNSIVELQSVCIGCDQNIACHVLENFISERVKYQIGSLFQTIGQYLAQMSIMCGIYPI